MKFDFEYGQGTMSAELPDNTDIFIPGETVKDPDHIPEDQLEAAYLESLAHPIGMPTLTELAGPGKTVTIVVPDRVKGGEQATSHRKLSIKYILKELYAAGFSAARYIHCIPASTPLNTSPLPAVAIPALPEMFKYISPKASATTVQASFRTQTAPDSFA